MNPHAFEAFVGQHNLPALPTSPQVIVSGLGCSETVDNAPPGARPEVLVKPDERAAVVAARATPLGKRLRHDFARDHTAQLQIALRVEAAHLHRIDAEELP